MRVLQIEDDVATATAVERMLASKGYTCDTVGLGEDAVAQARSHDYDVILLDIMLPDIDGFEVLRRLHAIGVDAPVLVQSGLIGREQKVEGLSLGVDDFLVKPFSKGELMGSIDTILQRARDGREDPDHDDRRSDRRAIPRAEGPGRRQSKRTRTLKSGQILYKNSSCVIDCLVLDLSETGAKLDAADIFDCPETFLLKILHGPTYRCEARWQTGKMIGVQFLTAPFGQASN